MFESGRRKFFNYIRIQNKNQQQFTKNYTKGIFGIIFCSNEIDFMKKNNENCIPKY